jgi:hypothetical protein
MNMERAVTQQLQTSAKGRNPIEKVATLIYKVYRSWLSEKYNI